MGDGKKDKSKLLRVRDRRTRHQFSIHNRIIDEWYPIIRARGYALYSLYCRMASKDEERCYPGYRMIAKHMGMGQSTISDYNKLLVWCGLIHIEPGDPTQNTPNDYYVLDIPTVTEETIAAIRAAAEDEMARLAAEREAKAKRLAQNGLTEEAAKVRKKKPGSFFTSLLKRLDRWRPIQAYWQKKKQRPSVVRSEQLSLFSAGDDSPAPGGEHPAPGGEHPGVNGEHPAPGGEHPVAGGEHPAPGSGAEQSKATIHNNNPKQQSTTTAITAVAAGEADGADAAVAHTEEVIADILDWMGFNGGLNRREKETVTADLLLAWAFWVQLEGPALAAQEKNPVGIARACWRRGEGPGGGLAAVAQLWLALDENGRRLLLEDAKMAPYRLNHEIYAATEAGLDGDEAATFYHLWQATKGRVGPPALMPAQAQEREEKKTAAEGVQDGETDESAPAGAEQDEATAVWQAARAALAQRLSPETAAGLLAGSRLTLTQSEAVIAAGNVYSAAWIKDRLLPLFTDTLREAAGRPLTVRVTVNGERYSVNGIR